MKKVFVFTIALFAIFACSKEKKIIDDTNNGSVELMTFTASVEDPIMDGQTKATLGKDGVFSWAVNDPVRFYKSDGTYTDGSLVEDSGVLSIVVANGEYVSAVYPAAAGDGEYSVAFDQVSGPIVVAEVTGGSELQFYHIGSMMTLNITGVPQACKLEVKPNEFDGTYNNGDYTFTNGVPTLTASTPSLTVFDVAAGNTGNLTASVANYDYANGFTLGLKDDNRYLYKKATTKDFDIATRATLLNMKALAYEAPTKFYVTTSSSSKYWDRSNVRMIQTGTDTYAVQMNCDGGTDVYIFDNYNIDNFANGYLNKGHVDGGKFYEISWNSSTKSGGPSYISDTRDYPFWHDSYPVGENGMCLSGSFNDWGYGEAFTYNTNMSWSLEGLELTGGTYTFKIRKTQNDWAYSAGGNSGLGAQSYGTLKGDANNASITLANGTYNVYLNATSDWYYNIMFEKQ